MLVLGVAYPQFYVVLVNKTVHLWEALYQLSYTPDRILLLIYSVKKVHQDGQESHLACEAGMTSVASQFVHQQKREDCGPGR